MVCFLCASSAFMAQRLRNERYKLLSSVERLLEGPMIFLGFAWLALLIIELVAGITRPLEYASLTIWAIFIFDFLIKIVLAPDKLLFLRKNWLTAVSLVIPALRVFRLLRYVRLLRGLRLVRVVSSVNRSMKSLAATMRRRGFAYVVLLTVVVAFAGAAGMYGLEKPNPGFENYGAALWWTAMRIVTAGSEAWPLTSEGRVLAFILALYGYAIFGYVTATLATFFIGRDVEERKTSAAAKDIELLKNKIDELTNVLKSRS
jgi:voltage-gated potassium channel